AARSAVPELKRAQTMARGGEAPEKRLPGRPGRRRSFLIVRAQGRNRRGLVDPRSYRGTTQTHRSRGMTQPATVEHLRAPRLRTARRAGLTAFLSSMSVTAYLAIAVLIVQLDYARWGTTHKRPFARFRRVAGFVSFFGIIMGELPEPSTPPVLWIRFFER